MHETTDSHPTTAGRSRRQVLGVAGGSLAGVVIAASVGSSARAGDSGGGHGGASFYPIDPKRVYDSRLDTYQPTGILPPASERVISVADGCDSAGTKVAHDMVPKGTVAVALTLTAVSPDGPNFLSIAPAEATEFASSSINFPGGFDIATSTIVKLGKERDVKVFSGDQTGSTHVVIDITGYFA